MHAEEKQNMLATNKNKTSINDILNILFTNKIMNFPWTKYLVFLIYNILIHASLVIRTTYKMSR